MDDIVDRMRAEEADLVRKLEAVRLFLSAYSAVEPVARSVNKVVGRATRPSLAARTDKFGSYGRAIVDTSLAILPDPHAGPMLTRDLLAKLEARGVEVRGENKINALSALLARSSQVRGHGRAGYTRAISRALDVKEIAGSDAPNEIEALNGDAASASVVSGEGAQTPVPAAWANYHSGVSS